MKLETQLNDEIKKTRILAGNAWKEQNEAERKTEETQRLWERQQNTIISM